MRDDLLILSLVLLAAGGACQEAPGFDASNGDAVYYKTVEPAPGLDGLFTQAASSMIAAAAEAPDAAGWQQPAARKGVFSVVLPPGAANLSLSLARHDFVFGTAFQPETLTDPEDREWYLNTTRSLFWGLTVENRFKWFNYEPRPGEIEPAKSLLSQHYIQFAQQHGFDQLRGHTLEWGFFKSFWPYALDCDAYVAALKHRITRDVTAFRGQFTHYDVFNELIVYPGMLDRCNLWNTTFPDAFKWAAEADPDAKLCINDFSLIEADAGPKLLRLINDYLVPNNAPIHCIGIQAHFEEFGIILENQQRGLDLLASTGLDLYITEFTLFSTWRGPSGRPESSLDEETQARQTLNLFNLWFSHPAVKGIYMWQWWDTNIWISDAGIFRRDKTPKKAALAIQDLWQRQWHTQLTVEQPATVTEFYGFEGTYDYSFVTPDGQQHSGRARFSKGQQLQHDLRPGAAGADSSS